MVIKNIIFDLGGVLLDISFPKTREAFIQSGVLNFDEYFQQSYAHPLFANLEKGLITPEAFYEEFRRDTGIPLTDEMIRNSWNALLGDFRKSSIDYLDVLRKNYRLFLFSNTNIIHYEAFIESFNLQYGQFSFNDFFEKAYYSHTMNYRKPDKDSFLVITNENKLTPSETLFVDDTYINIQGAASAGLQTLWLKEGKWIEEVLPPRLLTV